MKQKIFQYSRQCIAQLATTFDRLADSHLCQCFDKRLLCGLALFLGIASVAGGITLYMGMQAEARPFAPKVSGNAVRILKSTMVVVGNDALNSMPAPAFATARFSACSGPEVTGQRASCQTVSGQLPAGNSVRQRVSARVDSNDFCGPLPLPDPAATTRTAAGPRATMTLANGHLTTASDTPAGFNVSPLLQGSSFGMRFILPLGATQTDTASTFARQDDTIESHGLLPAFGQCLLPQNFAKTSILTFGGRAGFLSSIQTNSASAAKYAPLINQYATKYNLTPSLVKGIMRVESNFNPFAISSQQALGLMQVVPATAGGEVYAYLTGFKGQPSTELLLQPEANIQYGTTYLHLLSSRYFHGVLNKTSRELCVIAAYNGGPGAVVRLFGTCPEDAAMAINTLTPTEVYAALTSKMPSMETRQYVSSVLDHARDYGLSQD